MYCQKCKIEYPGDKKFCRECGSPLVKKGATCPKCQAPLTLKPDEKFCIECGAPLTPTITKIIEPRRRSTIKRFAIAIGCIFVGFAGSTILFYYYNFKIPFLREKVLSSPFLGYWINEDMNTRSITRVKIRSGPSGTVFVHMWGKCHPEDCDWGEQMANIDETDRSLSIEWRRDYGVRTQKLDILPDGRLRVISHMRFTDNSGREDFTDEGYFLKIQQKDQK